MSDPTTQAFIEGLKQQIAKAPDGVDVSQLEEAITALEAADLKRPADDERVKIWFLLDRSGSMGHLAEDVIGGFNQFVTEQAAKPGKARLTAVRRYRPVRSHLRCPQGHPGSLPHFNDISTPRCDTAV